MKKAVELIRLVFLALLFAILPSFFLFSADSSFTVIMGKDTAEDGNVMVAHNQDRSDKHCFVNVHKIAGGIHTAPQVVMLKNNGAAALAGKTVGFLWFEIPGADFCDSYMNENGVAITSDTCRSREDKPVLTDGGIGFMLPRLMAMRAESARQAVEIAGKLVQRFGFYGSGQSYAIADRSEAWVLHVVNGKRWLAKRVPDDEVAVVANRFTIDTVDLKDRDNYLGSPDIVQYARDRGWYNPKKDGPFDFARVYSAPASYNDGDNVLRHWRGASLLAKKRFKPDEALPFSFKPRKKLEVYNLFRVLRDHYEGAELDFKRPDGEDSPHAIDKRTICNDSTRYAFVAQLREKLPPEVANLAWVAFANPHANAFSPWYFAIPEPPKGFTFERSGDWLKNHFSPLKMAVNNVDYAFQSFSRLSQLVNRDHRNRIKIARKEWRNFENYALKRQKKMEKEFVYLVSKNKNIAVKLIANYVYQLEYRKWFQAWELAAGMSN